MTGLTGRRRLRVNARGRSLGDVVVAAIHPVLAHLFDQGGPPDAQTLGSTRDHATGILIAPLMGPFLQHYPEIDVQLRISDLSPDLIEDGFDLMVQVTDQPPEGLAGRPLGEVRQLLCASRAAG